MLQAVAIHCAQGQAWTLLALPLYCDDSYGIAWLCCLLLACTGEGSPGPFVASTSALASLVRAFIPGAPFSPWSRTRSSVFFRCSLPLLTSHKSVSSCILVSCLLVSFFFISSPCFSPLMGAELFPQPAKFSPSPILTKSLGKEILVCQKYMLSIRKFLVGSEQPGGQQGHLRGSSLSHASVGGFASLPPPPPCVSTYPGAWLALPLIAQGTAGRRAPSQQVGSFPAIWAPAEGPGGMGLTAKIRGLSKWAGLQDCSVGRGFSFPWAMGQGWEKK